MRVLRAGDPPLLWQEAGLQLGPGAQGGDSPRKGLILTKDSSLGRTQRTGNSSNYKLFNSKKIGVCRGRGRGGLFSLGNERASCEDQPQLPLGCPLACGALCPHVRPPGLHVQLSRGDVGCGCHMAACMSPVHTHLTWV